jgi:hypothetical protein
MGIDFVYSVLKKQKPPFGGGFCNKRKTKIIS